MPKEFTPHDQHGTIDTNKQSKKQNGERTTTIDRKREQERE